jgi:hypothetical protein
MKFTIIVKKCNFLICNNTEVGNFAYADIVITTYA